MPVSRPAPERFWEKVDASGDCWEWTASRTPKGYGQFHVGRTGDKHVMIHAHRFAYMDAVGPIAEGLELDHACRNRGCVNPMHLEPVTTRENQHRSPITFAGIHGSKTHCIHGHEFTAENIYMCQGARQCVACRRNRDAGRSR